MAEGFFRHLWCPRAVPAVCEAVHGGAPAALGGVGMHIHEAWQVCTLLRGDGWVRVRGVEHATPVGTLFVIPPGEAHANDTLSEGCDWRSVLIDDDAMGEACDASGLRLDLASLTRQPIVASRAVARRFVALHESLSDTGDSVEAETRFVDTLGEVLAHAAQRSPDAPPRATPDTVAAAVRETRDRLWDDPAADVSLSELAERCGMSVFELVRRFKRAYGMPPHAWRIQARIARAKAMLRRGESAGRVAVQTGFADQAHFTRAFRRAVGTTPARYGRAAREGRKIVQDRV